MVLLKTRIVVFLAVVIIEAASNPVDKVLLTVDHSGLEVEPIPKNISTTVTPTVSPNITTVTPTTVSPNTTTVTPPSSTTTEKPTTTTTPPTTTTISPNTTTTISPNTTTISPNTTTTITPTTHRPVTSTVPPTPSRSWDGPSFLGGMVLSFGIIAVAFVGYRFFYLGRGGAYHTL